MRLVPPASLLLFSALLAIGCGGDDKKNDTGDGPAADCDDADKITAYTDADGDGFGDPAGEQQVCALGAGVADNADDCDDANEASAPGKDEICDGLDNNCDTQADEGLSQSDYFPDNDGDGFGTDQGPPVQACAVPDGYAANTDDCDDTNELNYPGNPEVCDGVDNDCDNRADDQDPDVLEAGQTTYYADDDDDGYGDLAVPNAFCTAPPNSWVTNPDDCNDNNPNVNPLGVEICNTLDDNCDALVDDDDPTLDPASLNTWYEDADADDLGNALSSLQQCARPTDYVNNDDDCDDTSDQVLGPQNWRLDGDDDLFGAGVPVNACVAPADHVLAVGGADCDDANPDVNPGQLEVCNTVDDDCDADIDDADDSLDLATADLYHPDQDNDGFGNENQDMFLCVQLPNTVVDGSDCNDGQPSINPLGDEVCDGADNDCNGLRDDEDPGVDPADFTVWFPDMDDDGFGEISGAVESCDPPEDFVDDGNDCDDGDSTIVDPALWFADNDMDGHGAGVPVFGPSCTGPNGSAPEWFGEDCNDAANDISPSGTEVCEDAIDQDCDGEDLRCPLPRTCQEHLALDPAAVSGVYEIEPVPYAMNGIFDVWCDMDTDNGGWTLVGSSRNRALSDAAVPYSPNLSTLSPTLEVSGVWDLSDLLVGQNVDLRFACKALIGDAFMTVDLSFYDVHWYDEFTAGNDAASCFSEGDVASVDYLAPARTNNLTGDFLPLGDEWNAGLLEGEDTCADPDFTVDFDDRGVGGDPIDGTDWGFADGVKKCGPGVGQAWFLYVREL